MRARLSSLVPLFAFSLAAASGTQGLVEAISSDPARALREETRFELRKLDGTPWPNAQLTLVSWPIAAFAEHGALDVVRGRSDGQGIARLALLRGRLYRARAHELLAGGRVRFSTEHQELRAGPSRVLCAEYEARPRAMRIPELPELGPLQLVVESAGGFHPTQRFAIEGPGILPALPWARGRYEFRRENDEVLYASAIWPAHESMPPGRAEKPQTLSVGEPVRVLVSVQDSKGDPVAGARIRHRIYDGWSFLGCTNHEGLEDVFFGRGLFPMRKTTVYSCDFLVDHPSRAPIEVRDRVSVRDYGLCEGVRHEASVRVVLPKGFAREIRVLRADGAPWSKLELLARTVIARTRGKPHYGAPRRLVTDAEGRATLFVSDPGRAVRLFALPSSAELAASCEPGDDSNPAPVIWLADGALPAEATFAATDFVRLQVHVRNADGTGAPHALVLLEGAATAIEAGLRPRAMFAAGGRGKLVIHVHPDHGGPARAVSWQGLASGAATGALEADTTWTIDLPSTRRVRGRVRRKDGAVQPFADVSVSWKGYLPRAANTVAPARDTQHVQADAEGRFELALPVGAVVTIGAEAQFRVAGVHQTWLARGQVVEVPVLQSEEPPRVELVLENRRREMRRRAGG